MSAPAPMPLPMPAGLADNPRLDRWVAFPAPSRVAVSTGKVEIGQGVLTAMLQIAADELDVAPERIEMRSGDTDTTPNEGHTAGSQSIQFGGAALRMACAEIRARFLECAAAQLALPLGELGVRDGAITRHGEATGHDYWSLAPGVDLARPASGAAGLKSPARYEVVGRNLPRVDLAARVFGERAFIHDMALPGMRHARVLRQPGSGAAIASIDEAAIAKATGGAVEIVRHGNFVAVLGADETAVEKVGAILPNPVAWSGVEPLAPFQEEARWLLQRPSIDRAIGAPEPPDPPPGTTWREATYSRAYLAHASVAPSCGLALYENGRLTVWTHSQGVFPLRDALSRTLTLPPEAISVRHVPGPGCYGHNGADDAAADAALIAFLRPGRPVRVRWRREEEFAFEPVSPAMVVRVRAAVDAAGRPQDWTAEIWSGTHNTRPGGSQNVLFATALPEPPAPPPPSDVPEASGGGATRNAEPFYDVPAKRILHHLVPETPVRTSALRGLGATANVFAIESFIDELAEAAGTDPVAYRLAILSDPRARAVVLRVAHMSGWQADAPGRTGQGRGIACAQYKNRAAYAAIVAEIEVDETIGVRRVWCACDAGLVVNPDGAVNQLEGGIIQAVSWVLKEQVRLDETGIGSRDWETYPVLRFSEVPEIAVELVGAREDRPPLGVGEAAGGPTAAAIGNAVAHALGARLRDLPLTRERVMAALLSA